jgi:hypothetical protein
MTQTDSKKRHIGILYGVHTKTEIGRIRGGARARRQHDIVKVWMGRSKFNPSPKLVVVHNLGVNPVDFRQQLEQVVRVRVIIVNQQG